MRADSPRPMKKHLTTVLLVLVLLLGVGIMLYPSVSDAINRAHQTKVLDNYVQAASELTEEANEQILNQAREYNDALRSAEDPLFHPEDFPDYDALLNPDGVGVMGYVSIPKIRVTLPIYHGTEDAVLQKGAGHLIGSSLPIGGPGTHAVLSAHRGLPSAMLFTDLDKLEAGDTFQICVLNQVLNYQVDRISIVLPIETEELRIGPDADYVTLMTCTPYGINSHRLLVRGRRIESSQRRIIVSSDAYRVDPILIAAILFVPMLLVLLLIPKGRRKHRNA